MRGHILTVIAVRAIERVEGIWVRADCTSVSRDTQGCVDVTIVSIGPMDNKCYIVSDDSSETVPTIVIDPAGASQTLISLLQDHHVCALVATHNHYDHVLALPQLKAHCDACVCAHSLDAPLLTTGQAGYFGTWDKVDPVAVDRLLADGDVLSVGSLNFEVIHTPGHTPGGICLYLAAHNNKPGIVFTGDTLFKAATGRVDFEGGNATQMRASLRSRLAKLPDDTIVYPGHESSTTIGAERFRVIEAF